MDESGEQRRITAGRAARVAPLVGMAGRTAGEAVVASLRNRRHGEKDLIDFHTRQAERYAARLGRSRGVLMKAGQMLSVVSLDPAVDAPYRGIYQAAFARLQDDAPPMPPQLAIDTITTELGRSPREVFTEFDPRPMAAASIGQVHTATLPDGRRVAVKVQYPGVAEAIRADLKNTELLATFFQLMLTVVPGLKALDVRAMAAEVADRIGEEIDYYAEAANQQEYANLYRGHPFIRIPEVIPELSTRRVLTMDLSGGVRYAAALSAERSLRDAWGEAIFRFVQGNLLGTGLYNADPHPGNFLFHPDGSVTCLDFGCVKRFDPQVYSRFERLTQAAADQDAEALNRAAVEGGFLDLTDVVDHPDALLAFYSWGVQELVRPQPFTYTPEFAAEILRQGGAGWSPRGPYWPVLRRLRVDANYVVLTRHLTSLVSVLGGLRATGMWRAIREEYSHDAAPATRYGELEAAHRKARQ
ncbi:MAG TPA: AarF/ABC1/UbiB kinase family protein [Acidimicrobiales bacterium]|nr:AarF/ABC1/UbiB kinase family protein [Acidimicrobiales bacterium]